MGRSVRSMSVLVTSLALVLALSGCAGSALTAPPKAPAVPRSSALAMAQVEAVALMKRYDVHPVGSPEVSQELLGKPDMMTGPCCGASQAIGLDLNAHIGERLTLMSYLLRERNQAREGTITANFYVARGHVVGAWLDLWGYKGGGPALSDHSLFMPPGDLTPTHLVFEGVRSIDLAAGNDPQGVIHDPATIRRLLAMISASKRLRAVDDIGADDAYFLTLTHTTGAVTDIRIERPAKGGALFITFFHPDSLADIHLAPAPGMIRFIDSLPYVEVSSSSESHTGK